MDHEPHEAPGVPDVGHARTRIAASMRVAAAALLDSLDDAQRAMVEWPFADGERQRWFYTPTDHGGLALASMTPRQQQLTFQLVASGLSRAAYVTVTTIIGLDNVLDELEGWVSSWGRERGRDPGLYYVRVFGRPTHDRHWSWRFGGHHVSLHFTVIDGAVASVTPCFLGADPASSPLLGPHPLRPLAGAEDFARDLVQSFTADQRKIAVVSDVPPVDLVGANRSSMVDGLDPLPLADVWRGRFDGELGERVAAIQLAMEQAVGLGPGHLAAVRFGAAAKGIAVGSLSDAQRAALRVLLDCYVGRMPSDLAAVEADKYAGSRISELSFLWAGGLQPGEPHYYRIQGRRLVVEYDNTARSANHVHTVWRDPQGDFAADVLGQHYLDAHGS